MDVANSGGAMRYWFAQVLIEAAMEESDMVAAVASAQSSTSVSVHMNAQYVHGEATPRLQDEQWQHAAIEGEVKVGEVALECPHPLVAQGRHGAVLVRVQPLEQALAGVDDEVGDSRALGHGAHKCSQLGIGVKTVHTCAWQHGGSAGGSGGGKGGGKEAGSW